MGAFALFGQDKVFVPNYGQFQEEVVCRASMQHGMFYWDKDGWTFMFRSAKHEHDEGEHSHASERDYDLYTLKAKFVDANFSNWVVTDSSNHYQNYYLGDNPANWKSEVYLTSKMFFSEVYEGIDLVLYVDGGLPKFDFIVKPHADLNQIKWYYEGQDGINVKKNGKVIVSTPVGKAEENYTSVYQLKAPNIDFDFNKNGDTLSFDIPEYNQNLELVIDPQIVFSTFTGATSDNWGNTACPGSNTELYAGGIVFGPSFPLTAGAYDNTFNGGFGSSTAFDVTISKFSPDGSALLYSTFLGGDGNEIPQSIIVNNNDELVVFGSTSSTDFPTTTGAFRSSVNMAGVLISPSGLYFERSDVYIARFNSAGTALLGSTYYGGSGYDGINNTATLAYNYGDNFRGEVTVDENDNIYITGSTTSPDLPMANAFQPSLQGSTDGFVAKFDPSLSTLMFASYIGGANEDIGNGIQLASNGDIYVVGGSQGGIQTATGFAGDRDGFIAKINGATYALDAVRYVGTNSYDQIYFVQLDLNDKVYVYGQSLGNMAVSAGKYFNGNSAQFIKKFSKDLAVEEWSSMFGTGSGQVDISPTAFLVSDCGQIYVTGWGGKVNYQNGLAAMSTTVGLPTTPNAYQSTTSGNNFYIAVFEEDMTALNYGSFFGGAGAANNHVDGGTCRFDKYGNIYHAVCADCIDSGVHGGFTTTPGAYSGDNNSFNCNLGAFKFALNELESTLAVPEPFVCLPDPVVFDNQSQNGNTYYWDFGDGNTSTDPSPSHLYASTGVFDVMLVAFDTAGCYLPDTAYTQVEISEFNGGATGPASPVCPGDTVGLTAWGGTDYLWYPTLGFQDPYVSDPSVRVFETTEYFVIVSNVCGLDTVSVVVEAFGDSIQSLGDDIICVGDSAYIGVDNGVAFDWWNGVSVSDSTAQMVWVKPITTSTYSVDVETQEGCILQRDVIVEVDDPFPTITYTPYHKICNGTSVMLAVTGARAYQWSPSTYLSADTGSFVVATPPVDMEYVLESFNACGSITDTIIVEVVDFQMSVSPDTTICYGDEALLIAYGGIRYVWTPESGVLSTLEDSMWVRPLDDMAFQVVAYDENSCADTANVRVTVLDLPVINMGADIYAYEGDSVQLSASGDGTIVWQNSPYLSCEQCQMPYALPPSDMIFTASITDVNGCRNSGEIGVYYEPLIYVPNVFTPQGDGRNDEFVVYGTNIDEYHLMVFNRWGELIYESFQLGQNWDGRYNGVVVQDDVYVWKIAYKDIRGSEKTLYGHVTVVK